MSYVCPCCEKELALTSENFWRDNGSRTGFYYACKNCVKTDEYLSGRRRLAWRKATEKRSKARLAARLASPKQMSNQHPGHEERMQDHIIQYADVKKWARGL